MNLYKCRRQRSRLVYFLAAMLFLAPACGQERDSDSQNTIPVPEEQVRDSLTIEIVAEDSLDVLSVLQLSHKVVAKSSAMGDFVTSIDGVAGGSVCFWLYSVNGEMAQDACDRMMVGAGDTVRWHFRRTGN